jgi:hypothetical protein
MRTALLALVAVAACKGKLGSGSTGSAQPPPAPVVVIDWAKCEDTLTRGHHNPGGTTLSELIAACPVCGDWDPILRWNVTADQGGPTHAAVEAAMLRCDAFCDANAKQRFLNTLDDARGTEKKLPWHLLGEICKAKVGAVPDARYASPTMFALDRIAHAAGARKPDLLFGIQVVLPPVTVSGVGVDLPSVANVRDDLLVVQVTVLPNEVYVGRMPAAHLTPRGVRVDLGTPDPYPGAPAGDLHAQLAALVGDDPSRPVVILASNATPAGAITDVLTRLGPVPYNLFLGARLAGGPPDWVQAGLIPVPMVVAPDAHVETVELPHAATVADLARALSALPAHSYAFVHVKP